MINFSRLNKLKQRLDGLRPLPSAVVANLHEELVLQWTYNSNAIEGNTLTLKETKVVLEGVAVGGKTLHEHFEALNHHDAITYVEAVVENREAFSGHTIRSLHALILKNIDEENAGVWRKYNMAIAGARYVPPDVIQVQEQMDAFICWHEKDGQALHPVELAARTHADFVKIHPFMDGNGRTARLLMNLDLMRHGFPPVVLPVTQRLEYYEGLDTTPVEGHYEPFLSLIGSLAEQAFQPYWKALNLNKQRTIP